MLSKNMADLDTVSPVVWPKWCYTSKSLSFNLKKKRLLYIDIKPFKALLIVTRLPFNVNHMMAHGQVTKYVP